MVGWAYSVSLDPGMPLPRVSQTARGSPPTESIVFLSASTVDINYPLRNAVIIRCDGCFVSLCIRGPGVRVEG